MRRITRWIPWGIFLGSILVLAAPLAFANKPPEPNPVVVENRKPGTTDWQLEKVELDGKRSRTIEGFCSATSVRAGRELTVYVSTDPPSSYRVDLYRMGYYGGKGARHVRSLGPFEGVAQPTPAPGKNQVRECRWEPGFSITIPDDWLSGVYLGKLTAERSGAQSYVIFIVRDDRSADFLFQCSDLTWQAYNRWPAWGSLYDYKDNRWETERSNDISFDRPYARYYNGLPVSGDKVTHIVGAGEFLLWEFPLAFWMEKHGYDVTYISNLDTHRDPKGLLRARGFLSVGHDEYWTGRMIRNARAARKAGLSLAFLSGNSILHQVRLKPASDGQPHRIFARHREFETEQELMGAASYGVGFADWTCTRPEHWVFEGTGMERGDAIADLVGWEYHGPPLGEHDSLKVLARGNVHGGGDPPDKEYAATIYEGPSDNVIFNAATCWWSMPLASPPGFINPDHGDFRDPDPRVQRITRNILERIESSSQPSSAE